jgi:hypothetical protein
LVCPDIRQLPFCDNKDIIRDIMFYPGSLLLAKAISTRQQMIKQKQRYNVILHLPHSRVKNTVGYEKE